MRTSIDGSNGATKTVQANISRRGTGASEALQLEERALAAVSACREELNSLRAAVKGARSHREKSAMLHSVAAEAVLQLEELFDGIWGQAGGSASSSVNRAVPALATRLCAAIDRAEALVQVYGSMSSVGKMFSKLKSSNEAAEKFESVANELRQMAAQGRGLSASNASTQNVQQSQVSQPQLQQQQLQQEQGGPSPDGRESFSASQSASDMAMQSSSEMQRGHTASTTHLHTTASGDSGDSAQGLHLPPLSPNEISSPPTVAAAQRAHSNSIPEETLPIRPPVITAPLQPRQLRKSSRSETITAMGYVSPSLSDPAGASGRLWYYVGRMFGSDRFTVLDLGSGVSADVGGARAEGPVSAMHVDVYRGQVWTGHKSGAVMLWEESQRTPICPGIRVTNSPISAITVDENGVAWVGGERGDVRRVVLRHIKADGGAVLEKELRLEGGLRHSGSKHSERVVTAKLDEFGMVLNPKAREKAHEGKVTALAAAAGRVWTSGGATAFVCLREWTQRGELMAKHDLQAIGNAEAMILVTPIVRVTRHMEAAPSLQLSTSPQSIQSSFTSNAGGGGSTSIELPQAWQLLTGHSRGLLQVWGDVGGALRPLLRIDLGERTSPVTGLSICEPLGAICSSHLDGKVLVMTVPDPRGNGALPAMLVEKSIASAALPRGELKASDTGVSKMDGSAIGAITAGYDAGMHLWPESHLRAAAEQGGVQPQDPSTPLDEWRVFRLTPTAVHQATMALAKRSSDLTRRPSQQQPQTDTQSMLFSSGAQNWLIDYDDLSLERVVGEGAFGTVYIGKWNQTDVAVKVLSSLEALGISASEAANAITAAAKDGSELPSNVGEGLRTLQREVQLMTTMRHPNIILFLGVCMRPPCVVTEYCARGSLFDLLQEARENPRLGRELSWSCRLRIALEAAKGMLYLHSHRPPIIHRDLKSPNLLIDGHYHAKVTDFGLSRLSEASSVASSVVASNPRWQAPEVITEAKFTPSGDVYAFGLILWELATWELPFEGLSQFQIIVGVGHQGARPKIPDPDRQELRGGAFPGWQRYADLMQACWAQEASARPSFGAVIDGLRAVAEELAAGGGADAEGAQAVQQAAAEVRGENEKQSGNKLESLVHEEDAEETEARPSLVPAANGGEGSHRGGAPRDEENRQGPPEAAAATVVATKRAMASPFDAPVQRPGPVVVASPFDAPSATSAPAAPPPPPPPPSPFDAPAAGTAGGFPAPAPPMLSPFDAPAQRTAHVPAPAPALPPPRSPFDSAYVPRQPTAQTVALRPDDSASMVGIEHEEAMKVIDSVADAEGKMPEAGSARPATPPSSASLKSRGSVGDVSSKGGASGAGNFLRMFRESLKRDSMVRQSQRERDTSGEEGKNKPESVVEET